MLRIFSLFFLITYKVCSNNADITQQATVTEVPGGVQVTGNGNFSLITPKILSILVSYQNCDDVLICYAAKLSNNEYFNDDNDVCSPGYCFISFDSNCFTGKCTFENEGKLFHLSEDRKIVCPRNYASDMVQHFTVVSKGCKLVFKNAKIIKTEESKTDESSESSTATYVFIGVGVVLILILLAAIVLFIVLLVRQKKPKPDATKVPTTTMNKSNIQKLEQTTVDETATVIQVEGGEQMVCQEVPATGDQPNEIPVAQSDTTEAVTGEPSVQQPESNEVVKLDENTVFEPIMPYPKELRDFLEEAPPSLHRMGLLIYPTTPISEPTGGLHPFVFKLRKTYDLSMKRTIHPTELNLLMSTSGEKTYVALTKMIQSARGELTRNGMTFGKEERPDCLTLHDATLNFLKKSTTSGFVVLYVFALMHGTEFRYMRDTSAEKLERMSMAALLVTSMQYGLAESIRISAITRFRYRMAQLYRIFSKVEFKAMPYPVSLLSNISGRKATKLLYIAPDVSSVDDKYFDQAILAFAPEKVALIIQKNQRKKKRQASNEKATHLGDGGFKSVEKTTTSTEQGGQQSKESNTSVDGKNMFGSGSKDSGSKDTKEKH